MIDSINFLNQTLTVTMNRPLGTVHPRFPSIVYSANYGYISGMMGKDGTDLDAYVLGVDEPLVKFDGLCVGVIERLNDVIFCRKRQKKQD